MQEWNFNPRSHEESDLFYLVPNSSNQISIHALTKRSTDEPVQVVDLTRISIHALTKRSTGSLSLCPAYQKKFQSTLSRRDRHEGTWIRADIFEFQSTLSRRDRRYKLIHKLGHGNISIHALTKRSTAIYSILWLNFYLEVLVILIVLHF